MAEKTKKTMRDASGDEVPLKYVSAYNKKKDRIVRAIAAKAKKLRLALEAFAAETLKEMGKLVDSRGGFGERGNFSARSFDGLLDVSIRQAWQISLDERVVKARELMLSYTARSLALLGDEGYIIKRLVEAAFKTDSQGFLSRTRVTELLSLHVEDAEWEQGVTLLQDALSTVKGKRYLRVSERKRYQDDFRQIRLDLADCWPDDEQLKN